MTGIKKAAARKWRSYRKRPLSFVLFLLVNLAALITGALIIILVGYILIKGVPYLKPSLFAWKYTSENLSLLPAMVNTVTMTVLAL